VPDTWGLWGVQQTENEQSKQMRQDWKKSQCCIKLQSEKRHAQVALPIQVNAMITLIAAQASFHPSTSTASTSQNIEGPIAVAAEAAASKSERR
jgi:hypothetical protein